MNKTIFLPVQYTWDGMEIIYEAYSSKEKGEEELLKINKKMRDYPQWELIELDLIE
jgi:hypothetical protein